MTSTPKDHKRLHIDWTRCDGRGLCTELLPSMLRRDPWGYPLARDWSSEPDVPAEVLRDARAAVKRCPRLALSLLTSTTKSVEQQSNKSKHRKR